MNNKELDKLLKKCPDCEGDGFTAEHAGDMSCHNDDHRGCPVQVQCERCHAEGYFTSKQAVQSLLKQAELRGAVEELNKLPHGGLHDNGMFEYYEISKSYIDSRLALLESEITKLKGEE